MRNVLIFAASSALDVTEAAPLPEWVHLVPFGSWVGMGPRGSTLVIGKAEVDALAQNFGRDGVDLPIDWEHQTLHTQANGADAPAAGWIDRVEVRTDGLWGHVKRWTPRAADQLRAFEYRYFSPVIRWRSTDRKTGRPTGWALGPGALTNHPAFGGDLRPLVASTPLSGDPMDLLAALITLFAMPETATPEEVYAEAEKRCQPPEEMAASTDLLTAAREAMGWGDELPADAPAKLKEHLAAKAGIDPKEHLKVLAELEGLKASGGVEQLVKKGLESGKLVPSMVGAFKAMVTRDGAAAGAEWLDAAPVALHFDAQAGPAGKGARSGAGGLTATELAAAKSFGLSPAEYLAAKAK